ncbi:MAG: hypothetical protein Q9222_000156 [Ikaeria aurantiellina]
MEAPRPSECKYYSSLQEVPREYQKYYHQRYSLFSKYDDGILMTDSAWFGVTPEPVANKIAENIAEATPSSRSILIDCFSGVGGNTIAFARSGRWKRIYAIDKDENAIHCAKHNAELYGVGHQISWFHGDCFDIINSHLTPLGNYSVLFASPPWGGPSYQTSPVFDLSTMQPYSLNQLLGPFRRLCQEHALLLPRTSDLRQLAGESQDSHQIRATHYCMEGASKQALCVYFGAFNFP